MHNLSSFLHFDGVHREDGTSAFGWYVQACWCSERGPDSECWKEAASASVLLPTGTTSVDAELHGLEQVTQAILSLAMYGHIAFESCYVKLST